MILSLVVWLANAAPTPSASQVAMTLALLATVASPFLLKYVKLDGFAMSALTYGVALLIALVSSWLVGDLSLSRASALAVLGGSTSVWAIQQGVYALFKARWPDLVQLPAPGPLPTPSAPVHT